MRASIALLVAAAVLVPEAEARADPRLVWSEDFREPGTPELIAATGALVGTLLLEFLAAPEEARWTATPRLDEAARGRLVLEPDRRRRLRIASRILAWSVALQTELVDPAFVVWIGDENRAVARRMYAINGLALSATALLGAVLRVSTARARPYSRECVLERGYDPGCDGRGRHQSFPDSRVAIAFTAAALTCTHHRHLPIYGSRVGDALACGGAAAAAGLMALFAVLSDQQYVTDVIAGLVLGVASGFLLPAAYYGFGGRP